MKKVVSISALLLIFFCGVQAQVIYVKAGSNGNGTSWNKAYGDLQAALRSAKAGNEIWVASGIYHPTLNGDRTVFFNIPDGVKLYGGFKGNETAPGKRDAANDPSVLSGEIGDPSRREDNSFTVVYTKGVSAATLIDGFVIQGGFADGNGEKGDVRRCGAGWFNDGSYGSSNPRISNCTFTQNKGRDGGALYNYAHNGIANPVILNCRFILNEADLDGGAVFNDGTMGQCSPVIEASFFDGNRATYGAGIMNQGDNGEARPEIRNCRFLANISYIRGSSVYNNRSENGICLPIIQGCMFEDNQATVGRDVSSTVNNMVASERSSRTNIVLKAGF